MLGQIGVRRHVWTCPAVDRFPSRRRKYRRDLQKNVDGYACSGGHVFGIELGNRGLQRVEGSAEPVTERAIV